MVRVAATDLKFAKLHFVTQVGATCARWAPPDSCLGVFELSAERLHPSAQRQSAKLWPDAPADRFRAEAEVPEVCQTCVRKESLRTAGESCRPATFGTHRVADHSLTRVSYCPTSPCVPMHCFSTNPRPVQGKVDVLALFESLAPGRRGSPQVKWMDRRPLWPTVYGSVAVAIA